MNIIYPVNRQAPCIYKITNTKNGKVYIGQTKNYWSRSSDYANAHKKENTKTRMYKEIAKAGTENFVMEPIYVCENVEDLARYETYFIDKYDSTNPEKGYNVCYTIKPNQNDEASRMAKSLGHIGLKETAATKRKKSSPILAVKDDTLIICDSGKIFGDFVGKSKDYIKNCLRQPSMVEGFNLYYMDYTKRQVIREKMMEKRSIRNQKYMDNLDILDSIALEGVETIDLYFTVYTLSYNDDVSDNRLVLREYQELGTDYFAGQSGSAQPHVGSFVYMGEDIVRSISKYGIAVRW